MMESTKKKLRVYQKPTHFKRFIAINRLFFRYCLEISLFYLFFYFCWKTGVKYKIFKKLEKKSLFF